MDVICTIDACTPSYAEITCDHNNWGACAPIHSDSCAYDQLGCGSCDCHTISETSF